MAYTKEWKKQFVKDMNTFKVDKAKQKSVLKSIAYLDSGKVKKHSERNKKEEKEFQNAYDEVINMSMFIFNEQDKKDKRFIEKLEKIENGK